MFQKILDFVSRVTSRTRLLQYRGSRTVYITMMSFAKLYHLLFAGREYIILPTLWGVRLYIPKSSFASSRLLTLMLSLVEPQWRDYFDYYIARSTVFIDIGAASDAYYTLRSCKLNPRIKAIAVEPLVNEYKYLLLNVKDNSCIDRVIPINVALCEEEKVIEMSGQKIKCLTLDNLVETLKLPSVDVIKIDVEGAGAEIIRGGIKVIHNYKPVIFFEVHNISEKLVVERLEGKGYVAIERYGDMYILLPILPPQSFKT